MVIEPLRARGFAAEAATWTDAAIDWTAFDAVVMRSVWNYHLRFDEFSAWLERLETLGVRVINPMSLTRWNCSKRYLLELEEAGVRIPVTVLLSRNASRAEVERGLGEIGTTPIVVKPAVSASAHETWMMEGNAPGVIERVETLCRDGEVLLQEFVEEVQSDGELSIVFFGGEYSHAMLKRPRAGDFRVQSEHGGSSVVTTPDPEVIDAAAAMMGKLPMIPVFARMDGIVIDGNFTLMEAELLDAELFMQHAPGSADRFADAIVAGVS